jgi:hypothetical protein
VELDPSQKQLSLLDTQKAVAKGLASVIDRWIHLMALVEDSANSIRVVKLYKWATI